MSCEPHRSVAAEAVSAEDVAPSVPPNVREVMNYTRAEDAAFDWIKERPVTIPLLSNLQAEIVRGTNSDGPEAGALRERQVFVGTTNRPITEARSNPSRSGLEQLVGFMIAGLPWV